MTHLIAHSIMTSGTQGSAVQSDLFDLPWVPAPIAFDGKTYNSDRDYDRLQQLIVRVWLVMRDRQWHTLPELRARAGGTEASVSARLRDLRKDKYGSWEVERGYITRGLWKYRVTGKRIDRRAGYEPGIADGP